MLKSYRKREFHELMLLLLLTIALLLSSCAQTPGYLVENREECPSSETEALSDGSEAITGLNEATEFDDPEPKKNLNQMTIGLYDGIGVWDMNVEALQKFFEFYGLRYELFDENDVTSEYLGDQFDLIWFPGGFAAEYRYNIPSLNPIIDFVDQGGYFIGSCAGAYFAADILSWLGEEKKDHDYPLNFFPGRAAGPLVYEMNWGDEALLSLNRDFPFNTKFEPEIKVYYFDGPYFESFPGSETETLTLASYTTNQKPAVVAGSYGAGKYLLFGPHPEIGGINEQSGDYNLEGGNNAQWSWLLAVLYWFGDW